MKVSELIEALSLRQKDLEVFSVPCLDYPSQVGYPCVVWFDEYYENYARDKETADNWGYTNKVILL